MKLEGLRVLDVSLFLPGPMLTVMMADHGADVIKIEPPGPGEPTRDIGYRDGATSIWFRNTHRGKRSIQLDLKSAVDREIFCNLARDADVLIEAFRPGVADRLGIGWDAMRALNARLVYCSISAFGQTSAYAERPAHDVAVQALAGMLALNEGQDGKPAMPNLPSADALASLTALSGVMIALYRRDTTGRGDYLDISMFDSILAWTANVSGRVFATGQAHVPKQERSWGGNAMYNLYETDDGEWLVLGGSEAKFARNLLEALERPDLIRYALMPPGPEQEELRDYLRAVFKTRTRAGWEAWFAGRDIAFAPVRSLKEAFDDPDVIARGMLCHDAAGAPHVGTPIRFIEEPASLVLDVPDLDAHRTQGWRARTS